jgi:starch phosphorylase
MFYGPPQRYTEIMRSAIALNASFFNTQRMVMQYVENAYSRNGSVPVNTSASTVAGRQ